MSIDQAAGVAPEADELESEPAPVVGVLVGVLGGVAGGLLILQLLMVSLGLGSLI